MHALTLHKNRVVSESYLNPSVFTAATPLYCDPLKKALTMWSPGHAAANTKTRRAREGRRDILFHLS